MKVSEAFPSNSKWLSAGDLQGHEVKVRIMSVEVAEFDNGNKPALMFAGKNKGLVLNRTNARKIASAYGDDMELWQGKEIIIYPDVVEFQGKQVDAIRCRPVLPIADDSGAPF